jgi:1-hydroxycarotenoid 3,4-desaturase
MRVVGQRTPVDLAALGAPGGSIYGFLPHGKFGPFRRPRIRGGTPGLFFAGGGTHPGGGVPLVMLSGRFAAEMASAHLRRSA